MKAEGTGFEPVDVYTPSRLSKPLHYHSANPPLERVNEFTLSYLSHEAQLSEVGCPSEAPLSGTKEDFISIITIINDMRCAEGGSCHESEQNTVHDPVAFYDLLQETHHFNSAGERI